MVEFYFLIVLKENELTGKKFDKRYIFTYGLPTQRGLVKMRTSVDIAPAYDGNGVALLTMYQKWAVVFYRMLMPCVGSRREIILKLSYKKLSNVFTTSQEGYVLLELKNNWEKWTHLVWKKFDNNYEFEQDEENDLLQTLFS